MFVNERSDVVREEIRLRDGRLVAIRPLRMTDKEELVAFYAGLSPQVLRWALPPTTGLALRASSTTLHGRWESLEKLEVGLLAIFRYFQGGHE